MHKLLEKLDNLASSLVPLAYLVGMLIGTAAYFSGVVLDAGVAVGLALAFAVEVHGFLAQRRMRAMWGLLARMSEEDSRREELERQFKASIAVLLVLIGLSMYNGAAFLAKTWPIVPGFLPGWLQITIRATILPVLFLASGFLSPLTTDAGAILASASREMLHHTIKTTVRQWRQRIKRARRRNLNLAPVAIALMLDAGDADGARRIHMIDAGLAHAEAGHAPGEALSVAALDAPTLAGVFTPSPTPTPTPLAPVELATPTARPDDPLPDGGPDRGPRGGKPRPRPSSSRGSSRGEGLRLVGETPRRDSGMTRAQQEALYQRDMTLAAEILASEPVMSTRELARRLSVGRRFTCHPGRAATIRRALASDAASGATGDADGEARARA